MRSLVSAGSTTPKSAYIGELIFRREQGMRASGALMGRFRPPGRLLPALAFRHVANSHHGNNRKSETQIQGCEAVDVYPGTQWTLALTVDNLPRYPNGQPDKLRPNLVVFE